MSEQLWLVVFSYYSERADVHGVAAPDAESARSRVADLASVGELDGGKWVRRAVLEDSRVERVRDGLFVYQHAEH